MKNLLPHFLIFLTKLITFYILGGYVMDIINFQQLQWLPYKLFPEIFNLLLANLP